MSHTRYTNQTEKDRPEGLIGRLREKLAVTQRHFTQGVADLLLGQRALDDSLFDELETLLLSADVGVETTQFLLKGITDRVSRHQLNDTRAVYSALRQGILSIVEPCNRSLAVTSDKPCVIMVVGVVFGLQNIRQYQAARKRESARVSRSSFQMSETPSLRAAKRTVRPSARRQGA